MSDILSEGKKKFHLKQSNDNQRALCWCWGFYSVKRVCLIYIIKAVINFVWCMSEKPSFCLMGRCYFLMFVKEANFQLDKISVVS